jgi:hypothetical protein
VLTVSLRVPSNFAFQGFPKVGTLGDITSCDTCAREPAALQSEDVIAMFWAEVGVERADAMTSDTAGARRNGIVKVVGFVNRLEKYYQNVIDDNTSLGYSYVISL